MMNRFSCPVNSDPKNRVYFFYWDDMIAYLREGLEADGRTYRHHISNWNQSYAQRKNKKASCSLEWVRINPDTMMAETITRTVTCEDVDVLPTITRCVGSHTVKELMRAQW